MKKKMDVSAARKLAVSTIMHTNTSNQDRRDMTLAEFRQLVADRVDEVFIKREKKMMRAAQHGVQTDPIAASDNPNTNGGEPRHK